MASISPVFTLLHRSGLKLEFETLLDLMQQVVADLWHSKGKISGCLK